MANVNVGTLYWKVDADAKNIDKSLKASGKNVSSFGKAVTAATFASTLTISTAIAATNTIVWLKALSSTDESPANDTTADLQVDTTVVVA